MAAECAVVSIEYAGDEPTFDVEMDDEGHNFTANGIVSHNSHSYAYGTLSYMTAFLKANWPAQFAAATLACTDDDDRRAATLAGLRAEGFQVLAPSINHGQVVTSCGNDLQIRLGLAEIKGIGTEVAAAIVADRDLLGGSFEDLADLVRRVTVPGDDEQKKLDNGQLTALVEAGACDEFGPRKGMVMVLPALREHPDTPVIDAEFGCVERAARERDRLGTMVSESPLQIARREISQWRTPRERQAPMRLHQLPSNDNAEVITLGLLAAVDLKSYSGGRMAKIMLDGSRGSLEGVMFDSVVSRLDRTGSLPQVGDVVALRGRLRTREVQPPDRDADEDGSGTDIEADEAPVEKEFRREIIVNDVYPVAIHDDSYLQLPAPRINLMALVSIASAHSAAARQRDAEAAQAKAEGRSKRTPRRKPAAASSDTPALPGLPDASPTAAVAAPGATGQPPRRLPQLSTPTSKGRPRTARLSWCTSSLLLTENLWLISWAGTAGR